MPISKNKGEKILALLMIKPCFLIKKGKTIQPKTAPIRHNKENVR